MTTRFLLLTLEADRQCREAARMTARFGICVAVAAAVLTIARFA